MSSGVQSRRPRMTTARVAGDHYSSNQRQRVRDNRSRSLGFDAGAAEKTTTTTTTAAAQSRCYTTYRSDDAKRRLSDQSDTTTETSCSSGGGGVCSDDSRTTTDGTMSCVTSRNAVLSIQLQMQELFTVSGCPYLLDSADGFLNLPDDLIREVFRRISLKEIVRMTCLNSSWRSEIRRLIHDDGYSSRWKSWAPLTRTVSEGKHYCLDFLAGFKIVSFISCAPPNFSCFPYLASAEQPDSRARCLSRRVQSSNASETLRKARTFQRLRRLLPKFMTELLKCLHYCKHYSACIVGLLSLCISRKRTPTYQSLDFRLRAEPRLISETACNCRSQISGLPNIGPS